MQDEKDDVSEENSPARDPSRRRNLDKNRILAWDPGGKEDQGLSNNFTKKPERTSKARANTSR